MPRKSRIDAPGALQHIIARGINRQTIFTNKTDYREFLDRLSDIVSTGTTSCYAWALLPNHFHLLLRTGDTPISKVMQRLLTGYVVNYNRRHHRVGHLFQNRYKSILCQEETYLLELVRYIHLNPLRANVVPEYKDLAWYPYCGHSAILDHRRNDWQDVHFILSLFGDKEKMAIQRYDDFVRAGIEQGKRTDLTDGDLLLGYGGWAAVKGVGRSGAYQKGDGRILGDEDFIDKVLSRAEEHLEERYRVQSQGYNLDKLIKHIGKRMAMSPEEITEGGRERRKVEARAILCYLATTRLGVSQTQLAQILNLTQPAVSQAVKRGRDLTKSKVYSYFRDLSL